jgi:glycosyltransferase involved in cell wall biosynthesis
MGSGGAERVASNLINSWSELGYEVTLLITFSGRGSCDYKISEKVNILYLADEVCTSGRGILINIRRFLFIRNLIRKYNNGVVISFLTNVNVAALLAGSFLKARIIVSERIYPPMLHLGWLLEALRRLTYPLADRVVMLTSEGLTWLEKEIPLAKGVIIPNPISFPLVPSIPILRPSDWLSHDRRMLLSVGRLSEQKGFECLISSFSKLSNRYQNWDLVILGEGPLLKNLKILVERLRLPGRVHFPGRAGNVNAWYERADLYVMSSLFEGFPNALGEAMAHGCAAVSFDCDTGPRDMICHEVNGLLVNVIGDAQELGISLERLMGDDLLRAQMSEKSIDVRERYSMQSILSAWEKLFESVGA